MYNSFRLTKYTAQDIRICIKLEHTRLPKVSHSRLFYDNENFRGPNFALAKKLLISFLKIK